MNLLKRTTAFVAVMLVIGTAGCNRPSSDAAITGRVKTAISEAPELKGTKVSVSTNDKVVHLGGTVKSRAERAMLIGVARKVEGVKSVKTDLVVAPQQNPTIKPQQNAGSKPQQKPAVEASGKREQRVQLRGTSPGTGAPPER